MQDANIAHGCMLMLGNAAAAAAAVGRFCRYICLGKPVANGGYLIFSTFRISLSKIKIELFRLLTPLFGSVNLWLLCRDSGQEKEGQGERLRRRRRQGQRRVSAVKLVLDLTN